MKSLKSKILLILVLLLSVLQFSLVLMMSHDGHETICTFDEHCILQIISATPEAVLPLIAITFPVFFVFVLQTSLKKIEFRVFNSPPNLRYWQTLKGIIQRE